MTRFLLRKTIVFVTFIIAACGPTGRPSHSAEVVFQEAKQVVHLDALTQTLHIRQCSDATPPPYTRECLGIKMPHSLQTNHKERGTGQIDYI